MDNFKNIHHLFGRGGWQMSKKILLIFSLTVVVISFVLNIFAADQLKEYISCQASPAGEKYEEVFSGFENMFLK